MNIFKTCFNALRHPFSVEGGITRGEYFVILAMSVFLMVLSYMGIDAIAYNIMMGDMDTLIIGTLVIISDLIILFLAIPMITSTVRRLHDVGVP